jgi:cell division protein ZapA (FtsZ GTPase activity inhibitor)
LPELVAINILIGDRNYRIKIDPNDEETVRRVVKTIQDKIIEFKTQFSGKDMQDYIAMVLVWFATEQSSPSSGQTLPSDIIAKLDSLENALDTALMP